MLAQEGTVLFMQGWGKGREEKEGVCKSASTHAYLCTGLSAQGRPSARTRLQSRTCLRSRAG